MNANFFLFRWQRACAAALILGAMPMAAPSAEYDLIVLNGRILDGTGAAAISGDVAVRDGKIAALGKLDAGATAPRVLDAAGSYIAPGFIDVHTHCEDDLLDQPQAYNFVRMGVTSVVMGNCGGSYANLEEGFTSHTQTGLGLNVASLVGHNTVRRKVMANANRDPSTTEMQSMRSMVADGMRAGAVGLSTGLIYTPGLYSKTPELKELAREASRYGGLYVSHMRSEGDSIQQAIQEAIDIGRDAACPVQLSHFKISAATRHGQTTMTIKMVEDARAQGLDIAVDQYVYTASSTSISTMLPDWAVEGTSTETRNRLADPATRERIVQEIVSGRRSAGRPDMSYARVAFFKADPSVSGLSVLDLAKKWRGSDTWEAQAETVADIMSSGGASMVFHSMAEEDVRNVAAYANTMFASDSGVRTFGRGVPHPRGYGNNARVLSNYVRALKLLTVEEAVRKMTSLPARRFGLHDRGVLRPGAAADLVVFDLNEVHDPATYDKPHAYAEGFRHVLVNGLPVIENKQTTDALPGKVLYGPARSKSFVAAGPGSVLRR